MHIQSMPLVGILCQDRPGYQRMLQSLHPDSSYLPALPVNWLKPRLPAIRCGDSLPCLPWRKTPQPVHHSERRCGRYLGPYGVSTDALCGRWNLLLWLRAQRDRACSRIRRVHVCPAVHPSFEGSPALVHVSLRPSVAMRMRPERGRKIVIGWPCIPRSARGRHQESMRATAVRLGTASRRGWR